MAKNAVTDGGPAVQAGSKAIVNGVFRLDRVQTSEDLPREVLTEIKKAFPDEVRFVGEVPTEARSVVVGQPLPKDRWHSLALAIARRFDGKALNPVFTPVVV